VLIEKIKGEKERLIKEKKIKKQKPLAPINEGEIPFDIPENWVWCRLGTPIHYADNLDIQKHLNPSELINYVDIDAIDNKSYCIREAKQKRVEELSSRARRVLKNGFIVYSTVRPYLKNIAIVEDELHNMIGTTGFNVFKPIQLETKFLFYFLLNPDLNVEYERMMIGFNSPSITNTQFENTLLPIPPKEEQQRIVAKLDELMAYCDDLEASIKESQIQNELLLQQVLREALEPVSDISSAGMPKEKEIVG
jgi:type I restriction enzyme S subunit